LIPVIEGNEIFALDTKKSAPENTFIGEVCLESAILCKVLEYYNSAVVTLYCIGILRDFRSSR